MSTELAAIRRPAGRGHVIEVTLPDGRPAWRIVFRHRGRTMSTSTPDRLFPVGAPTTAERAARRAGNRTAQLALSLDLELELAAICPACSGDHAGDACPHGTALELDLRSAAKAPGLWHIEGEQVHTAGNPAEALEAHHGATS